MPRFESDIPAELFTDQQQLWVLSLVSKYEARLTRYAWRLTGDLDSARDVVQHAFLRLCDQSPDKVQDAKA